MTKVTISIFLMTKFVMGISPYDKVSHGTQHLSSSRMGKRDGGAHRLCVLPRRRRRPGVQRQRGQHRAGVVARRQPAERDGGEAIIGISTEAQTQTSDIIRITDKIKESKVPAIFVESTINPKLMEQIAEDNNVSIGGKLYADSIGDKDSPASTYHDMLKHNTDVIVEALTSTQLINQESNVSKPGNVKLSYFILGAIALGGLLLIIMKMSK